MKKNVLKIDIDRFFGDRKIRLLSMPARGFMLELKMLCTGGYLLVNGLPMSDEHIRSLTNCTLANLRIWMRELGDAGIFRVDDDGLYFPDMVKAEKKELKEKKKPTPKPQRTEQRKVNESINPTASGLSAVEQLNVQQPKLSAPALPWYRTPSGWVKEGQKQGLSYDAENETMDTFKHRVASRLGNGPHLDHVPASIKAAVLAKIEKEAEMMKKA